MQPEETDPVYDTKVSAMSRNASTHSEAGTPPLKAVPMKRSSVPLQWSRSRLQAGRTDTWGDPRPYQTLTLQGRRGGSSRQRCAGAPGAKPSIAWLRDQFPEQLLVDHVKQWSFEVSYIAATNAAGVCEAAATHSLPLLVWSTPTSPHPADEVAGFIILL